MLVRPLSIVGRLAGLCLAISTIGASEKQQRPGDVSCHAAALGQVLADTGQWCPVGGSIAVSLRPDYSGEVPTLRSDISSKLEFADVSGAAWLTPQLLAFTVSPIEGESPGVFVWDTDADTVRCLMRPRTINSLYPAGADYFELVGVMGAQRDTLAIYYSPNVDTLAFPTLRTSASIYLIGSRGGPLRRCLPGERARLLALGGRSTAPESRNAHDWQSLSRPRTYPDSRLRQHATILGLTLDESPVEAWRRQLGPATFTQLNDAAGYCGRLCYGALARDDSTVLVACASEMSGGTIEFVRFARSDRVGRDRESCAPPDSESEDADRAYYAAAYGVTPEVLESEGARSPLVGRSLSTLGGLRLGLHLDAVLRMLGPPSRTSGCRLVWDYYSRIAGPKGPVGHEWGQIVCTIVHASVTAVEIERGSVGD